MLHDVGRGFAEYEIRRGRDRVLRRSDLAEFRAAGSEQVMNRYELHPNHRSGVMAVSRSSIAASISATLSARSCRTVPGMDCRRYASRGATLVRGSLMRRSTVTVSAIIVCLPVRLRYAWSQSVVKSGGLRLSPPAIPTTACRQCWLRPVLAPHIRIRGNIAPHGLSPRLEQVQTAGGIPPG